jgi:sugar lactone lactonase YvrE
MKFTALNVPKCAVGEGPVWDVEQQAFYWIDIIGRKVFLLDDATGAVRQWDVPEIIGSMAICQDGNAAIVALSSGVHRLDFATGECALVASSPDLNEQVQLADGKVDRRGRFIVGSSDRSMQSARGKLYVLDPGANELRAIDEGIILANGPCFSNDDTVLYHADSQALTIFAYDYDIATGTVSNKRFFASTADLGGIPDGATVDAQDHIWSAICEGGKIVRFRPDGTIERIIEFPQKIPGSVMFGGPNLDRLYVPTLSPAFLGREPDPRDGMTFVIDDIGLAGVPEPRFGA